MLQTQGFHSYVCLWSEARKEWNFFMKISLTKKFWALLITILFLLVIFANNVKASEYLNTVQDISEKIGYQETKQDSFEEEKILQYDAKTGKTTEINMEDISKKLL